LPETVKLVLEALVKVEMPLTVKAVALALPNWLETNREPFKDWTMPVVRDVMVVEPLGKTENKPVPVEEATVSRLAVEVVTVPWTVSRAPGVVVPMPTLPWAVTLKIAVPVEELKLKISLLPALP
jgi:hypothetical protein